MFPRHNGVYEFFNRQLQSPTIFSLAKKGGYTTIYQTDFPVILGPYLGFTKDIDHYFIENEKKAFKTLLAHRDKQTMSFFHFGGVHYPYGFHTLKFGGIDYKKKVAFLEKKYNISKRERDGLDDILDETFRNKLDTLYLFRYKYIIEKLYREEKYDDLFSLYVDGINYFMKSRFNPFLKKLTQFIDETGGLLCVFSDHGEEWDKNSEGHHNSLSENVLRVPLLLYGNGITPGVNNDVVRTIDLAPTLLNFLPKLKKKISMDGRTLTYSNKLSKKNSKYAISQVWSSIATKKQMSEHQSLAIKNTRVVKPLKTYLFAEAIQTDQTRISRFYQKNGSLLKEDVVKHTATHKSLEVKLRNILKKYNTVKPKKAATLSLEKKMRNELRNLGYRI
jgi:choline-sulfatase